jgi:peptidoglycan/xylan/chitin deacetylase (PgdA/CDA1 family)
MDWTPLDRALAARSSPLQLWWRDDDAGAWSPVLARLLALAQRHGVPLAVAAVPARLDAEARARLAAAPSVTLLVHGHAHVNHAPAGEKKAEFGLHRPLAAMRAELLAARRLMPQAAPVFVPPWNRIDPAVAALLPELGFTGLSTHGRRRMALPGLVQVNTQVDPVDWRGTRGFIGAAATLALVADAAVQGEVVGLLTHHATMREDLWQFFDQLLDSLLKRDAVRWPTVGELFSMSA